HFEGVANTTFVPLVARIYFSKRFPDVFYDEKALELEPYLPDKATKGSFEYTNIASVARYYITDRMVEDFIEAHGPSNVIYFGAGLESAYFRISKKLGQGKAFFYEIDLPEVIETRRKVFGENENEKLIGGDMFSFDWASGIADKGLPTIMIVSGVFQYFLEEDILRFIKRLSGLFPGQEFIFDATSTKGLKFTNWFIKRTGNKEALMTFGVDDSKAFADKADATLLEEKLFFEELRVILKKRANFISRFSMKNSDDGKKCLIIRLKLGEK
ncbi:MAG: class I SAM-dependent methyltransferase, partial [Bacilli bacterium]|nr:class I SAM-dependent methyltransferase [Bacilli bacterium]